MKFVSTAWIPGTLAQFESSQCLAIHAELGRSTPKNPLTVFILEGFSKLPDEYLRRLEEHYIYVHDAEQIFRSVSERFSQLEDYLGNGPGSGYEFSCFLRWLVIEEALAGEPFVHLDLDLFFQDDFEDLEPLFRGSTGTFGSPCLTVVSDAAWLDGYRGALHRLVSAPVEFQTEIGFFGNEFRANIGSDQDLIVQLERQRLLPAEGLERIWESKAVFINPLHPDRYGPPSTPHRLVSKNGRDHIDDKPVLFWHLQNNFADYLARFAVIRHFERDAASGSKSTRLNFPIIQVEPSAENYAFHALRELCTRQLHLNMREDGSIDFTSLSIERYFSRSWITRWFVVQGEGRELFSSDYWWQEGVFQHNATVD